MDSNPHLGGSQDAPGSNGICNSSSAVMGDLLKEIQNMSSEAADALKQAGFETDSDIQSLTRLDLYELLPGRQDLRLRKDLFEMIHKSRPPIMQQKELGDLQNDSASFFPSGAVMGDLLKEIQIISQKAAVVLKQAGLETDSDIQSVTREDLNELLPGAGDFKLRKNVFETIKKSSKLKSMQILPNDNVDPLTNNNTRQLDSKAEKGGSNARMSFHYPQEVTVKYKMVVAGETFGAHTQLMDQVKRATKGNVRLLENSQDSQIIIVFCPITTRPDSDVKAAMTGVPGDKPVILVKMHHVCESKSSLCRNTLSDDRNIVLQVNVFYHVNCGLLKCKLNEKAVDEIQKELLKHSDHRSTDTRASTAVQILYNLAKDYVDVGLEGTTDGARCQEGNI